MNFSISARVSARDAVEGLYGSRGMIWKRSCINLFIIYFWQIVLWSK